MSTATAPETAAERRKRRILSKGEERMARVMGAYGKDAESETAEGTPDAPSSSIHADNSTQGDGATGTSVSAAAPSPESATAGASTVRRRGHKGTDREIRGSVSEGASEEEPQPDAVTAALLRSAKLTSVSFPAAIIAGAYQTQAVRFGMAAIAAVLAVSGHLQMNGVAPLLQLVFSNAMITLSAAWMLHQQPERFKLMDYQMQLRAGGMLEKAFGFASSVVGKSLVMYVKAFIAMGWAAYVDSGCYITIVIALYLFWHGSTGPNAATLAADRLKGAQEDFASAARQGADAVKAR